MPSGLPKQRSAVPASLHKGPVALSRPTRANQMSPDGASASPTTLDLTVTLDRRPSFQCITSPARPIHRLPSRAGASTLTCAKLTGW